jgi:hypothetical protein
MTDKLRINPYRLVAYDYSQPGAYFVTICVEGRKNLFGEIIDDQMQLNDAGVFSQRCWQEIPQHFANVSLDEFVVMPNHVHGIIIINPGNNLGVQHVEPYRTPNAWRVTSGLFMVRWGQSYGVLNRLSPDGSELTPK